MDRIEKIRVVLRLSLLLVVLVAFYRISWALVLSGVFALLAGVALAVILRTWDSPAAPTPRRSGE